MERYFVTAIGTDSGKTLVSAILCEALQADYWKPIQAGAPYDKDTVSSLVHFPGFHCHEEAYLLHHPMSPHAAANREGIVIELDRIAPPQTNNNLIVEGAGGVLVPLNDVDLIVDLIKRLAFEVILVSNTYLGSINHTLLTAKVLADYAVKVKGIIFNGDENSETESIILKHTGYHMLMRVPKLKHIDHQVLKALAHTLKIRLNEIE